MVQGIETLLSTRAVGNVRTGDVWLKEGGTLIEPTNTMNGKWVHYNFNSKTGEIRKIDGKSKMIFIPRSMPPFIRTASSWTRAAPVRAARR
jgi:hypothetical protein